jgi:hypothetical protein
MNPNTLLSNDSGPKCGKQILAGFGLALLYLKDMETSSKGERRFWLIECHGKFIMVRFQMGFVFSITVPAKIIQHASDQNIFGLELSMTTTRTKLTRDRHPVEKITGVQSFLPLKFSN